MDPVLGREATLEGGQLCPDSAAFVVGGKITRVPRVMFGVPPNILTGDPAKR